MQKRWEGDPAAPEGEAGGCAEQQANTDYNLGPGFKNAPLGTGRAHRVSSFWLLPVLNFLKEGGGKEERDGPWLLCRC